MYNYTIIGKVLPERAKLDLNLCSLKISPVENNNEIDSMDISIILNQIYVNYSTEKNRLSVFDIRNIVKTILTDILSIFGFIKSYAYDVEITRIVNKELNIDYVFGIETHLIEKRNLNKDLNLELQKILDLIFKERENAIFIRRCLNDLVNAMKNPIDTGFYCYRAIESLKQYCKYKYNLEKEADQWKKLSNITGFNKDKIKLIREFSLTTRHGDIKSISDENRGKILADTWDIVEKFFEVVNK